MFNKKFNIQTIASKPVYDHRMDPFEAILLDQNINIHEDRPSDSNDIKFNQEELTDHSNRRSSPEFPKRGSRNKRKSVKQQAESLFDFNAKPVSLSKFFSDLKVESTFQFSTDPESEHNQIETKSITNDSCFNNVQSAAEIILSSKIIEDDIVFDYNLDCLFIEPIEKEVETQLPQISEKFESEERPSKELFVKRRLFSAVQLSQQVDQQWTEEFFKIGRSLAKLDPNKLFDDNSDSIHELRKLFRRSAIDSTLLGTFFDPFEDQVNLDKLSTFGFKPGFELLYNHVIAMYVVFNDEKFIKKRDSTVQQLNEKFGFLPFDFSLRQVFNSIGIGFFCDYFDFKKRIGLVAPFVAGRFKDKAKKDSFIIDRNVSNIKRKKKIEINFSSDDYVSD